MFATSEPIDVWVLFKNNFVQPCLFIWNKRHIKVDKVNFVHTTKSGLSLFYHFSVSSGGNFYRLKFDTAKLAWSLEMVEEGG